MTRIIPSQTSHCTTQHPASFCCFAIFCAIKFHHPTIRELFVLAFASIEYIWGISCCVVASILVIVTELLLQSQVSQAGVRENNISVYCMFWVEWILKLTTSLHCGMSYSVVSYCLGVISSMFCCTTVKHAISLQTQKHYFRCYISFAEIYRLQWLPFVIVSYPLWLFALLSYYMSGELMIKNTDDKNTVLRLECYKWVSRQWN